MGYATLLRCRKCGQEFSLKPMNLCEVCLSPLEVIYDYEAISSAVTRETIATGPVSMWRYVDLLPVETEPVDLGTGFSPLVKAPNLGRELGLDNLYIKNDCLTPTYSFKDRAVAVAVTKAKEFGFDTIACASTGNLAASVAAHAAKAGLKAYVFIPKGLELGKLVGIGIYNPVIVQVDGSYDDVNRLCGKLVREYKWGFINVNLRPYYAEGSKTLGFEAAEQLGWRAPDCVLAPSASGLLFTRIYKGFDEMQKLGLIPPVSTRMFVTQAAGSSPIVNAFTAGTAHVHPVIPNTVAKSIAIGNPADGIYALRIARQTNGGACAVPDDEIVSAIKLLAQTEGIFAEAASGVVIAALKRLAGEGKIKRHEVTVAFVTAAGPRTQEIFADIVKTHKVQPSLESFQQVMGLSS